MDILIFFQAFQATVFLNKIFYFHIELETPVKFVNSVGIYVHVFH